MGDRMEVCWPLLVEVRKPHYLHVLEARLLCIISVVSGLRFM